MDKHQLITKVNFLLGIDGRRTPKENEWIEFKQNCSKKSKECGESIGQYISALANGAATVDEPEAYLLYGLQDDPVSPKPVGTFFDPQSVLVGNEELEKWLHRRLSPNINFRFFRFEYDKGVFLTLFIIPAAKEIPIAFNEKQFIRIGSNVQPLNSYPEKARLIWQQKQVVLQRQKNFEEQSAKTSLDEQQVLELLDAHAWFELCNIPYPQTQAGVIDVFTKKKLIDSFDGKFNITNLGALLFAKDLEQFDHLARKKLRLVVYDGLNKVKAKYDGFMPKGYAAGFGEVSDKVTAQLPVNEELQRFLRTERKMYPESSIRELLVNALAHQDLESHDYPIVEIYDNRVAFSNPGKPLIDESRFINENTSRNPLLMDRMRDMRICEERGSGWDKVIFENEFYQLPPVRIKVTDARTTIIMSAYKPLEELDKEERVLACYQHACLLLVSNQYMTNETLRNRFQIPDDKHTTASRIIKDTLEADLIKRKDQGASKKHAKYVPFWA